MNKINLQDLDENLELIDTPRKVEKPIPKSPLPVTPERGKLTKIERRKERLSKQNREI